jgi:hypothetical protein
MIDRNKATESNSSSSVLLDELKILPMHTERIPILDQLMELAGMLSHGSPEREIVLRDAVHMVAMYANPRVIVRSSKAVSQKRKEKP